MKKLHSTINKLWYIIIIIMIAFVSFYLCSTRAESSHHCEHIGSSPPTNKSRRSTVLLDKLMCNMDSRIRPDADGTCNHFVAFFANLLHSFEKDSDIYVVK